MTIDFLLEQAECVQIESSSILTSWNVHPDEFVFLWEEEGEEYEVFIPKGSEVEKTEEGYIVHDNLGECVLVRPYKLILV